MRQEIVKKHNIIKNGRYDRDKVEASEFLFEAMHLAHTGRA